MENSDDENFKTDVMAVFSEFRGELLQLLSTSQMHIYMFAFKHHNHGGTDVFANTPYTDLFFDREGCQLDLPSIKKTFNKSLMGVFYKVSVPL